MVRMSLLCLALTACAVDQDAEDLGGGGDDGDAATIVSETSTEVVTETGRHVVVTDTDIEILDRIDFASSSNVMLGDAPEQKPSGRTLDAVAATIASGGLSLISVRGHVEPGETGGVVLAEARARSVIEALVARGVPREVLVGEPADEPGRGIDFIIVQRGGESE